MDRAQKYGVFTCFYKNDVVWSWSMENDQNKPWFRAKQYGVGWVPASWQGWLVTLTYTLLIIGSALVFTRIATQSPDALGSNLESDLIIVRFCVWIFTVTLFLLWVCYKTGDTYSKK